MDSATQQAEQMSRFKRLTKLAGRLARAGLRLARITMVVLVGIVAIGLIPVNNDFQEPPDGIDVYFYASADHADIVFPLHNEVFDWSARFASCDFHDQLEGAAHLAIGWGDREFFIHTETWDQFNATTAIRAMFWPSRSCLHVSLPTDPSSLIAARRVTINREQYRRLCQHVESSFCRSAAGAAFQQIPDAAYGSRDAFFEAHGRYHALNTCGNWVGRAMKRSGIRVAWLSPIPVTTQLYLPSPTDRSK